MSYDFTVSTHSVYLHWPFCPYRCHFCPFVALASHEQFMEQYHHALIKELVSFAHKADGKRELKTVFIGGGTPSTYPNDLLLDMFDKLKGKFDIKDDAEVSIEVNPGTVSEDQLLLWKKLGINRISVGVQSLDDSVLKVLNRQQSADDVRVLLGQASTIFENISVDLILGLPGVPASAWKTMLEEVVSWPIKHVSIYFLTVHENTRLYFDVQQHKKIVPTDDMIIDLYHWSVCFLKRHGFNQYETSNFARLGYQCIHNIVYWERHPYKGFGLGACSFDGKSRFQNQKNLTAYVERATHGEDPTEFTETLTGEQIRLERIMLKLRRSCGVARDELFDGLTDVKKKALDESIQLLKRHHYLKEKNGKLVLTATGFVVQNEVAIRLSL